MRSALIGIVRNEGRGIFEWALYHAFLGFDAVIVYDNGSTDDTLAEVGRAARHADIRVLDWPLRPGQIQAYDHALETFRDFDVLAMLDADEFLVPLRHDDIRSFLASTDGLSHVAVQWTMYGSGGHVEPPVGLVTESYTWRAAKPNRHVKTICRPSLFREPGRFVNPHVVTGGSYSFADGSPVQWLERKPGKVVQHGPPIARINHYWTKSRAEFEAKKARGTADGKRARDDRFEEVDCNEVEDPVLPERFGTVLARIGSARPGTGDVKPSVGRPGSCVAVADRR